MTDTHTLTQAVTQAAMELGFVRVGYCPASPLLRGREALRTWLEAGHQATMQYMHTNERMRSTPTEVMDAAKTVITVAMAYQKPAPAPQPATLKGTVAGYAQGDDYHMVFKDRLGRLSNKLGVLLQRPVLSRPCVDSAPVLERELADASGIGFLAKNTMIIARGLGSYILLGELLVDVALEPTPQEKPGCGQCTACLVACPTQAFVAPHILDARKCISYLTIEHRGMIPRDLRRHIGTMVFGCDICQRVCPFNASDKSRPTDPAFEPRESLSHPDLVAWLNMTSSDYRRLTKHSALRRAPRAQLMRNAAIALGNTKSPQAVAPLQQALRENRYPVVRAHSAWALGHIGTAPAREALQEAYQHEFHRDVLDEIQWALGQSTLNPRK